MTTLALPHSFGWLRSPGFDLLLMVGVAALALTCGGLVALDPGLFSIILVLDLWILGYHHVVSTFTRIAFDQASFREHRFLVLGLPLVVVAGVLAGALWIGGWVLSTTYLYWQWFHYTRQSYGIERSYRRKAVGAVVGDARLARWALYLLPLWGILHRSHQAPQLFLGVPLKVLPVPGWLVSVAAVAALAALAAWLTQAGMAILRGHRPQAHTVYVVSHMLVFAFGYLILEDIDHGWLVVNVWHNAQYILFVWLFNSNRFRAGLDPKAQFLSFLSQKSNWPWYFLTSLGLSTLLYFGLDTVVATLDHRTALPMFLVVYQAVNFHHYVVDGLIWKLRRKKVSRHIDPATR